MRFGAIAMAIAAATMLAAPSAANAAWARATAFVNMRDCPSMRCEKIAVVPRGSRVWINDREGRWYRIRFDGMRGYVSAGYVDARGEWRRDRFRDRPQRPRYGYHRYPWWDERYHAWHDGRRWYRNGIWYNDPNGLSFGFSFGG